VIRRGVEWVGLGGWGEKDTGMGGLVLRDWVIEELCFEES